MSTFGGLGHEVHWGETHESVSCMLRRLVGRLDIGGGACRKPSCSAFREADVFVIEFTKNVMARTSILNPS